MPTSPRAKMMSDLAEREYRPVPAREATEMMSPSAERRMAASQRIGENPRGNSPMAKDMRAAQDAHQRLVWLEGLPRWTKAEAAEVSQLREKLRDMDASLDLEPRLMDDRGALLRESYEEPGMRVDRYQGRMPTPRRR